MMYKPREIIDYWFSEKIKPAWFKSTPELDNEIKERYALLWEQAAAGELDSWHESPEGCLALTIILDQFPLNMFRGKAKSFSTEQKAVEVAWHAVKNNFDQLLEKEQRAFLYMPFMHSESIAEQDLSVKLFRESGLDNNLRFAEHHCELIKKYGRFPHRNEILGRESTPEELEYLNSDKAFKG